MMTVGEVKLDLFVLPMAYLGLNIHIPLAFTVYNKGHFNRSFQYHEDDLNLEKEQSFF